MSSSFFVNTGGSAAERETISNDLTASANSKADAQKLAINPEDSQFTLSDNTTTGNSALHHAAKAEASATSATGSASTATQQAGIATQAKLDAQAATATALIYRDAANVSVSSAVLLTGDQTIAGAKTFSNALTVNGTVTADGLTVDSGTTDTVATFQSSGDANAYLVVKDSGSSGGAFIGAVGTHTILGTGGSVERMRIDSSGNVGIGVSSLLNPLEIKVTANTNTKSTGSAFDGAAVRINSVAGMQSTGSEIALLAGGNDSLQAGIGFMRESNSTWGTAIKFYNHVASTSGATDDLQEVMRIDSSGNLLVNTTSLSVVENGGFAVKPQTGNGTRLDISNAGESMLVGRTGSDGQAILFYRGGTGVGNISVTGSSTSYNTSSDYRLKTDAQPMTGATARLKQLNPVNFQWIADGTRVDGFLAHEAQAVVPESVTGTKDAMKDEEYEVTPAVLDADDNVVTEAVMGTRSVPEYQGIDQAKLVPLLVATIQELEARITALEA